MSADHPEECKPKLRLPLAEANTRDTAAMKFLHPLTHSEIRRGVLNIPQPRQGDFWAGMDRFDIMSEHGNLYYRKVGSRNTKNQSRFLWLTRLWLRQFQPGQTLVFTKRDDATVEVVVK